MAKKSTNKPASVALAVTRIMLGFVFLWAFFDKLIGLGFATKPEMAWLSGGSPTTGFLKFGSNPDSPFADFFAAIAGQAWVDWLFMLGLLGIGLGLILGVAMRLSAVSGIAMMLMMWAALIPLENNPIIDDHLVYAGILAYLGLTLTATQRWSLGGWWRSLDFVKKNAWLW